MSKAGQVDVRFSVQNAEVVRLALANLGKDGEKALKQFDAAAKPVPRSMAAVGKGVDEAKAQAQAFASQLGPLGRLLTSVGPAGLVAAGAAGAVALAFHKASQAAGQFADEMGKLRDNADAFGLTTMQLQAINDEGSKFALTEDKIAQALQRFTASMEEMRRGTGELFNLVRRIDPALAAEMAQARDTATAIDVLRRVYERAGAARAQLDRMIGGRQGAAAVGGLFSTLDMQKVEEGFRKSGDAIEDKMIRRVTELKREIDDMSGDARRNFAAIFSVELLEAQHKSAELWRDLSRSARNFELSGDLRKFLDGPAQAASGWIPDWLKNLSAWSHLPPGTLAAIRNFQTGGLARVPEGVSGALAADESGFASAFPNLQSDEESKRAEARRKLELTLNLERERIGLLGSAALAADRLAQRERELSLALTDKRISQQEYNRAFDLAKLESATQIESRRIGFLGDAARPPANDNAPPLERTGTAGR